jgi:hypothetical protein
MSLEVPKQSTIAQVPSKNQRERKRSGAGGGVTGLGNLGSPVGGNGIATHEPTIISGMWI